MLITVLQEREEMTARSYRLGRDIFNAYIGVNDDFKLKINTKFFAFLFGGMKRKPLYLSQQTTKL